MKALLIADDHEIIRQGIKMMIAKKFGEGYSFLEASTCKEIEKLLASQTVHHIILDMFLSDGNAFAIIDKIGEQYPQTTILIYTMNAEKIYARRLMQKGVRGFVSKQASIAELEQAIKSFLNGETYLCPTLKETVSGKELAAAEVNPIDLLSDRELEMVEYLVMGLGAKEIANKMNVVMATVSTYKNRAFEKFGVENNTELKDKFLLYKGK
jgi:two-component system, NarL family, invasion response regulator UvrY